MAPIAGHKVRVYAKASSNPTGSSSHLIAGINDHTYEELSTIFETTSFKTAATDTWKRRLAGLNDGKVDLSGDYESSDAPQALLRTSRASGATVYFGVIWDSAASSGSQGVEVPCLVENFSVKAGVDGKVEFSCSLAFTGAIVAV